LSVVWLRKWSIIAITLATVGVALFVSSRQTPIYESQGRVLVTPVTGVGAEVPLQELNLATEAELVRSVAVADIVSQQLGFDGPARQLLGPLVVDQPADTEILIIGYRDADPFVAQEFASAFAEAYLKFRTDTVTEAVLSRAANIQAQVAELTDDFDAVNRQLQALSETDPNRDLLEARATLLSQQIIPLRLELVSLPDEITVGSVIEPAAFPFAPVSPNHVVNGIFGFVAGLGLGIGLAFVRDRLSERTRSSEEAEAYLEAPILASIPRVSSWRRRKDPFLVSAIQWRSPAAEGYRVLRTNVLSAASTSRVKSIAVTSPHAGEGKSSTVANLGVVLARAGQNVTLVSADLRRPRLHEFFKRDSEPGLIEVLGGRVRLAHAIQRIHLPTRGFDTDAATLQFVPSGRVPDDPTELIVADRMAEVIRSLEETSDIVLLDLPPVLPVTDALVVASITRCVLLVIGPKSDTRPILISMRQQLDRVGADIIGGVLNGPHPAMTQTYYSY
jgi:capsular exopolysaccharide synthesis family protein